MKKEYGSEKGEKVFYASKNKGTITGVEGKKAEMAKKLPSKPQLSQRDQYAKAMYGATKKGGSSGVGVGY